MLLIYIIAPMLLFVILHNLLTLKFRYIITTEYEFYKNDIAGKKKHRVIRIFAINQRVGLKSKRFGRIYLEQKYAGTHPDGTNKWEDTQFLRKTLHGDIVPFEVEYEIEVE